MNPESRPQVVTAETTCGPCYVPAIMARRKESTPEKTLAEQARELHAQNPTLTIVEIQHRIGAKSHQQVAAALEATPGRRGGRPRTAVRLLFDKAEHERLTALAAAKRKPSLEAWILGLIAAEVRKSDP